MARWSLRRSLLTLSKWLQAEPPTVEPLLGDRLCSSPSANGLLAPLGFFPPSSSGRRRLSHPQQLSAPPPPPLQPLDGLLGSAEMATGALLRHALAVCPTLPKAWATYAGWCYRWGRRVIDAPRWGPQAGGFLSHLLQNCLKQIGRAHV